jgi:hypothetical protein
MQVRVLAQIVEDWMARLPVNFNLGKDRKINSELTCQKLFDLFIVPRFLAHKLIARECQYFQTTLFEIFV